MATEERDETADWIVPAERRPPSVLELQQQIEVAMAVARAAEEAAMEIGAASIEAAQQARRAAEMAERAAEASVAAARAASAVPESRPAPASTPPPAPPAPAVDGAGLPRTVDPRPPAQPDPFDERMVAFRDRAERVMARLQRLEAASPVS